MKVFSFFKKKLHYAAARNTHTHILFFLILTRKKKNHNNSITHRFYLRVIYVNYALADMFTVHFLLFTLHHDGDGAYFLFLLQSFNSFFPLLIVVVRHLF